MIFKKSARVPIGVSKIKKMIDLVETAENVAERRGKIITDV